MDESDIAEQADIDVVAPNSADSPPRPSSALLKFVFADLVPVGERADKVVVQVLAVPSEVGGFERAHPGSVQEVELRDGLRLAAAGFECLRVEARLVPRRGRHPHSLYGGPAINRPDPDALEPSLLSGSGSHAGSDSGTVGPSTDAA